MRVLLVEDDTMVGEAIRDALKDASYAADWVRSGPDALAALSCHQYGCLLLDLGLPGKDGLQVLDDIRRSGNPLPVLIITARDALSDRIHGLDAGADDYLLKPFEMIELLARMRAILRRKSNIAALCLSNGIVTLDPATHEARTASGDAVILSHREFGLLQALLIRPGAILSRRELEERIYGWGEEIDSNAIDFIIHALRRKLGSDAIRNIRGAGWMVAKGE